MLTEREKKLIATYYTRLSLAPPAIITALLVTGPFAICELIRNEAFGAGGVGAIDLACYISIFIVLIGYGLFAIIFVNVGMNGHEWQELIRKPDFRGASYVSRFGMQFGRMRSIKKIKSVAAFYDVPIPIIGAKQAVIVLVPLLIMAVASVPSIILSYQHSNELIAVRTQVAEKYDKAFDGYYVGHNNMDSRTNSYYSVMYADQYDHDIYAYIDIKKTGELEGISIRYPLDLRKTPQENYSEASAFIIDVLKRTHNSGNPLGELKDYDVEEVMAKASEEYVKGEKNEDTYNSDSYSNGGYTSFSSNVTTDRPYFYYRLRERD